jgi:hypothetical protein
MSERERIWEVLFQRALELMDAARQAGGTLDHWSFGGGTVLMRRHRHRLSKDIDIFVTDPQIFPYLSPRLNEKAEAMTSDYQEANEYLKLIFAEGEIDFVASAPLTSEPYVEETIFGRAVKVETASEIVAKKVWHRGALFKARDIFDLAMVLDREPQALKAIAPILRARSDDILRRMDGTPDLREAFEALEVLEFGKSYDECVALARQALLDA